MKETIKRLLEHMEWADGEIYTRCHDAHGEMEVAHLTEALRLYSHIVAAERLWYLRLQKEDWTVQKVWPTMSLEACGKMATQNAALFSRALVPGTVAFLQRIPKQTRRIFVTMSCAPAPSSETIPSGH